MIDQLPVEQAKREAIHAARNAQHAVEVAREIELKEAVEKTAQRTKEALLEGLQEVFGEPDGSDPKQMRVVHQKIPMLCGRVDRMDANLIDLKADVAEIKDNIKWGVRVAIGAFITLSIGGIISSIY